MTYQEWKQDYIDHDTPEGGWALCDYDKPVYAEEWGQEAIYNILKGAKL